MKKNKIISLILGIVAPFLSIKMSWALPKKSKVEVFEYSITCQEFADDYIRHHIESDHVVRLRDGTKVINLGNYKTVKNTEKRAGMSRRQDEDVKLHQYHVLFRALRIACPCIPYTSVQVPVTYHKLYHADLPSKKIDYGEFSGMINYFSDLKACIVKSF